MKPKLLIVDLNHLLYRYGDRFFLEYITLEQALNNIDSAIKTVKDYIKSDKVIIVADLSCPSRKLYYKELLNNKDETEYKEGR